MAPHAAVGIHDDLAACQACVAHRSTDDEPPGGIDVMFDAGGIVESFRHDRLDHVFEHIAFDLLVRDLVTVLG